MLENLRYHKGEEKNDHGLRQGACRRSATSMSTTPSHRRIGRMPRSRRIAHLLPRLCRAPADGRDHGAQPSAGESGAAGHGHCRRRQGLDQDRGPHPSRRRAWTSSRSAAAWPTPSSPPRASRPAASLVEPEFIETAKEIMARARAGRLRDRASDRRRGGEGVQAGRRLAGLPGRRTCPPMP